VAAYDEADASRRRGTKDGAKDGTKD